ncbi:uncharacterized protein METZ01_LOCUS507827, partial [marine metagenome]
VCKLVSPRVEGIFDQALIEITRIFSD